MAAEKVASLDRSGSTTREVNARPPLLSIVVPAYNVASYVEDAILSALGQSYQNIEVIVVNDGSKDATPDVIEKLARDTSDARLKIIHQDNRGLSAARNTGIAASSGDYIGFLDSDDLWCRHKAERHMSRLLSDDSIGISFSFSKCIDENGRPTGQILRPRKLYPVLHDMIRSNHLGNGSTPVVRRVCFQVAGTFREDLRSCEDYEMWCRILRMTALRFEALPEPLTLYRLRDSSLSFAVDNFIANGEAAISILARDHNEAPRYLFRAARAELYRIAAWKAELTNRHGVAVELLLKSIRFWPLAFLYDFRSAVTALALFLPPKRRSQLRDWYRMRHNQF